MEKGRRARRGPLRQFGMYALITLVPVVALGLVLGRVFRHEADRHALQQALATAHAIAEAGVEPALAGHDLSSGVTANERRRLIATTGPLLVSGNAMQLRVRDRAGHIMFDAAHPASAPVRNIKPDDEVTEAAEGHVVATRTRFGADQVDGGKMTGAQAVEVYLALRPVDGNGKTVGVLELYVPYAPIASAVDGSLHRLHLALIAGLFVLWIVLGLISWSVTRRLRRQVAMNEYLARHDGLTELPNRVRFNECVVEALDGAGRRHSTVAIAAIDLDRFKEVNDTLGHHNGDAFLRGIAARIAVAIGEQGTLARLGGDEFGLVMPDLDETGALHVLARVQQALALGVELDGIAVSAEASIGVAIAPHDGADSGAILQSAELAMHAAKEARSGIVRFGDELQHFDPKRLSLVGELRRAIANDELVLHYQPKVSARSGEVHSIEALVRWQHPTRGLLAPIEFLPIAESTGIIGPLTQWVVTRALRQIVDWGEAMPAAVAVNVSPRNLRDERLPDWVFERMRSYGVEPSRLHLEITETSVLSDPARATALLHRFAEHGIRVSLDDFGQGSTSLSYLSRLPISELKIDRSFVDAMQASRQDHAIVASVIALGHQLGLSVVAEGVETEAACDALRDLGCDEIQGYYFARPMPPRELTAWLREHEARVLGIAR